MALGSIADGRRIGGRSPSLCGGRDACFGTGGALAVMSPVSARGSRLQGYGRGDIIHVLSKLHKQELGQAAEAGGRRIKKA